MREQENTLKSRLKMIHETRGRFKMGHGSEAYAAAVKIAREA